MLIIIGLLVWLVAATLIASILQVVIVWLLQQFGALPPMTANQETVLLGFVSYGLILLVLLGAPWLVLRKRPTLELLGLQRALRWVDIGLALSGVVLYFLVVYVVTLITSELFPQIDQNQVQETGISMPFGFERTLVFILFVIAGPIVEEVLFRGYLQGALRKNGVPVVLTIAIVSIAFGAAHGQWNVGINVAVLGVMMSIAREITGTIWPGVLMHMIKNGIAFYVLYVIGLSVGG